MEAISSLLASLHIAANTVGGHRAKLTVRLHRVVVDALGLGDPPCIGQCPETGLFRAKQELLTMLFRSL